MVDGGRESNPKGGAMNWNGLGAAARLSAGMIALLIVNACSGSNVLGPDNQPEVSNQTDTFEWQVTGMDNISQTLTYTWQNTGVVADVNQSPNLSGGSASIIIEDAAGTEVYSGNLSLVGTYRTAGGSAGAWTIRVTLSGASGALNFRAEKP